MDALELNACHFVAQFIHSFLGTWNESVKTIPKISLESIVSFKAYVAHYSTILQCNIWGLIGIEDKLTDEPDLNCSKEKVKREMQPQTQHTNSPATIYINSYV